MSEKTIKVESVDVSIKYATNDKVEYTMKDDKIVSFKKIEGQEEVKELPKEEIVDKNEKKEEIKEEKNVETKTVKALMVAIARNKSVVKYEGNDVWVHVSEELQAKDYKEIGLLARNEVELTLINNIITGVKLINSPNKENKQVDESPNGSYNKKTYGRDEDATDKRTASMNTKDIVVALLNNNKIEPKQVKEVSTDLMKHLYKTCKEL